MESGSSVAIGGLTPGFRLRCIRATLRFEMRSRESEMVLYRRSRVAGGTYFFTVALADRQSRLLIDHVARLRAAFQQTRIRWPYETIAIVILPSHLHCIWKLPTDYSTRWRAIKSRFTRSLPTDVRQNHRSVWQPRYWEHTIRDEDDLCQHVNHIHFNPVKHGFVDRVGDWPHSSFHRYVQRGWLNEDWGGSMKPDASNYGEPHG